MFMFVTWLSVKGSEFIFIRHLMYLLQLPINPYGKAKKMAEDIILDFSKNSDMAIMILRLVLLGYLRVFNLFNCYNLLKF